MNKNYLMMFLLVNANFKSERFEKIIVERGQYIFSYDGLSRDCGMPLQTLRTTLKDLVETNQITIKSTRKWSLLTICEYDSWQNLYDETNTQVVTQTGTQVVTQMDNNIINKEIDNKESKDIKEEESNDSKKKEPESELEKQFEAFRRKYKEYGGSARGFSTEIENLKKKHKDWKDVIPMLAFALENENKAREDAKRMGEFFPQMKNLQTYINQRSWEAYSDGYENYDPDAYHPDGFPYDADFDAYRFCDYIPNHDLLDGYTDDNRPDGARIVEQITVWVWSREQRRWNKELKK